jgi:hypothetical protein
MDTNAVNFNPSANLNNVSISDTSNPCSYGVLGCIDPLACNYDSLATLNDGSCTMPGCTDTLACNYNATAGCDDGSCDLPNGCGDALYLEYDTTVTCSDPLACITPVVNGCMDTLAYNYNSLANVDDGSCLSCALSASTVVVDETAAGASDGAIDLTVTGSTCMTDIQVGSDTISSYMSYLMYQYYMDGRTQITYPAAELAALGMSAGDIMDELAWNILSQTGDASTYVMNSAQMTVDGIVVYSGNYLPYVGMNNFVFSTPVTYTGGDLVVEWCFDNAAYSSFGSYNYFECTTTPGTMTQYSDLATSSGCGLTALSARNDRPNAYIGFLSTGIVNYAWSNGDTTEDISGLAAGAYTVIATDCNGCGVTLLQQFL